MMKGKLVKIKKSLVRDERYGAEIFVQEMEKYRDKVAKITTVFDDGTFNIDIDDSAWTWTPEMVDMLSCERCLYMDVALFGDPCKNCDDFYSEFVKG